MPKGTKSSNHLTIVVDHEQPYQPTGLRGHSLPLCDSAWCFSRACDSSKVALSSTKTARPQQEQQQQRGLCRETATLPAIPEIEQLAAAADKRSLLVCHQPAAIQGCGFTCINNRSSSTPGSMIA